MKLARLFGLVVVSLFAVGAMLASVASAADPEFTTLPAGSSVTSLSLALTTLTLLRSSAGDTVVCTHERSSAAITGMTSVGKVVVNYTDCALHNSTGVCSISSKTPGNVGAGEVQTTTLRGLLGLTSESSTGVGELFTPETGKIFVTFQPTGSPCSTPIEAAEGEVAGEVTPINKVVSDGQLIFLPSPAGGHIQKIETIRVPSGTAKPVLLSFGALESSQQQETLVTYAGTVVID